MSEKNCAGCNAAITDFSGTLYCFSCDALFCNECAKKHVKPDGIQWTCPKCKKASTLDEGALFRRNS